MKKLWILLILLTFILTGCKNAPEEEPKDVISDNPIDAEILINGRFMREPSLEFFRELGFEREGKEKANQGCDTCDAEVTKFVKASSNFYIEGATSEKNGFSDGEDAVYYQYIITYTGEGEGCVELSGGFILGETTFDETKELLKDVRFGESIDENLASITYYTSDLYPINLYFENDVLFKIRAFSEEMPYQKEDATTVIGLDGTFVDTTVLDIANYVWRRNSFVFVAGFENCPYCKRMLPYLKTVADENGIKVGYLNTRKNPNWESNLDIDNYDIFKELFGEFLKEDENGIPHLYVPDIYFIHNGEVVGRINSIEGADDPDAPLTKEQEKELLSMLRECFNKL